MKKKIYTLILLGSFPFVFSQTGNVGINTATPTATLDVNGTARIATAPAVTAGTLSSHQILAIDNTTRQVKAVDPNLLTAANAGVNTSVYAARKTTGISLLSLGLFPSGFRAVNFLAAERTVGSATLFSDTDNTYTVPSDGIYDINFSFRYGVGIQASLLSASPGIGIVRTRAGVSTLIDSRTFSGANLILLSLTISDSTINSLYSLQAGDKISFGLTSSGLLDAGLLDASTSSMSIYKVSN